jgi:hypothetical protein
MVTAVAVAVTTSTTTDGAGFRSHRPRALDLPSGVPSVVVYREVPWLAMIAGAIA